MANFIWGSINGVPFGPGGTLYGPITLTQGTLTADNPGIVNTVTWNNAAITFNGWKFTVTDTASASGSLPLQILGGAAGATNLIKVAKDGNTVVGGTFTAGSSILAEVASAVGWGIRSRMKSPADGSVSVLNNAETGFTTLNLGPATANTASGTTQLGHVVTTINMATATGTGTGTITSPTTALPAGALIKGVTMRITTILAGAGLTTISIGDGTDADRWGAAIAVAAGTTTTIANYTVTAPAYQVAAGSIVLTAAAGVLSTGIATFTTHYENQIPIAV